MVRFSQSLDDRQSKNRENQYQKQEDNYYWNYYINDEYAPVGVSSYKIKENDVYTFKLEKFE